MPSLSNLWPDEISVEEVLTPLAIMNYQAGELRKQTKGLVEAEVTELMEADENSDRYAFDLIAPALDRYRYRLFVAWHRRNQVYPVNINSDALLRVEEAWTQEGFEQVLARIFADKSTIALIYAIKAQSAEARVRRGERGDESAGLAK